MGPGQVKYCADNDIEAAEALAACPDEAAEIVKRCRAEYGHMGASQVKYCADNDIEAAKALGRY
jgi:hypothetical protein